MKKVFFINMVLFFIISNTNAAFSGEKKYNHEVEFGTSTAEKILQINGNGRVNITGYNGNKILISSNKDIFGKEDSKVNEKAKGLTKIGGGGFFIINNKQRNNIIISRPIEEKMDLDVQVPNNITLKFGNEINNQEPIEELRLRLFELEAAKKQLSEKAKELNNLEVKRLKEEIAKIDKEMQDISLPQKPQISAVNLMRVSSGIFIGDISIKNFSGIVEVSVGEGNITAENIDGQIIASTVDGDINIIFKKINKDKPLYFSTVKGDIDITFPKDINADIMSSTTQGDIYSGFSGDVGIGDESANEKGIIRSQTSFHNFIFPPNYITTRINNGGQKIYLNTINGNIYIRKGS